jgi:transposase-like protein
MPIVTLRLPDVKRQIEIRPKACPHCHGATFQRWGKCLKPVKDQRHRTISVYRYRCCHCRRTFRHYPEGVDRADQTQRLRKLVALMWVLGLSLRHTCTVLAAFGISLSHMSVWRDLQEQADLQRKRRQWLQTRVLGVDGAYVRCQGKTQPVLVAVDLGRGEPVAVGYVDEQDPQAVLRFLQPLVQRLGVSVIVTDDHPSFRPVTDKLQVEHQVCQFHVRRWVGGMLRQLRETIPPEWLSIVEQAKTILDELPIDGDRHLLALYQQVGVARQGRDQEWSPVDRLRWLLIRLSENWHRYRVFDWQPEVPWTNNGTEQMIGRMKMRSRTVRGYKSPRGMLAALLLAGLGATC